MTLKLYLGSLHFSSSFDASSAGVLCFARCSGVQEERAEAPQVPVGPVDGGGDPALLPRLVGHPGESRRQGHQGGVEGHLSLN